MANEIFSPFGAQVTGIMGGDFASKLQTYITADTDAVPLYIGDFVQIKGSSRQDTNSSWYTVCARAEAGNIILGVVAGFEPTSANLDTTHRKANEERLVYVHEYPYIEFEIQSDGNLGNSDVGNNADIKYYPAQSNGAFSKSGGAIDGTTVDDAPAQVRIVGFAASSGPSDNFPIMRCIVNEHIFKQLIGS
jgi:hypothetical protein